MNVAGGVDRTAVFVDLVMHVGAGRATAGPHQCHHLALLDDIADLDQVFFVVRVAGGVAPAVIDFDHIAIAVAITRPGHHATGNGDHIGAELAGKVDTLVPHLLSGEGVLALAVGR